MSETVKCLILRQIHVPKEDALPLNTATAEPFGARLGETFERWAKYFDARFVEVPTNKLEGFTDYFSQGGWEVRLAL